MRHAPDVGLYCMRSVLVDFILFVLRAPYRMAVLAPMAEGLLVGNLVGLTQLRVMPLACRDRGRPPAAAPNPHFVANATKKKKKKYKR